MHDRERDRGVRPESGMRGLARFSAIITILPASMAAGWIIGYLLVDRTLGIYPWGGVLFTLLGAGAGFYEIVKILAPGGHQDEGLNGRH